MIDLSIIIVNLNNSKLLKECIASIYNSTHKISIEIILSDNGSTDDSVQMVKTSFPQVKVIENEENLGFSKANNKGLKIAVGRYKMLLNNDTIVKDGAFDALVAYMDQNPKVGACGPKLLNVDGSIQRQGGIFNQKFWLSPSPTEVKFVIGACLLVRKETITKVGLMDENLFFYNDDLDWCISIRRAGYKIMFVPQAELTHYGGFSSKRTFNKQLFIEGFRGGIYFSRKHYGLLASIIYRLFLLIGTIIAIPFYVLVPKPDYNAKLRAFLGIFLLVFNPKI
jgi:GT2 family glycosyltransferase